jgi:putative tryptophan/tyrosine transport system substrate-binding protein
VSGAAVWPFVARGQQGERLRRVGVLTPLGTEDPDEQATMPVFLQSLKELGWIVTTIYGSITALPVEV